MSKVRTWPFALVSHPEDEARFNIRHPAGHVLIAGGITLHATAKELTAVLNDAFDLGREIYEKSHGGRS